MDKTYRIWWGWLRAAGKLLTLAKGQPYGVNVELCVLARRDDLLYHRAHRFVAEVEIVGAFHEERGLRVEAVEGFEHEAQALIAPVDRAIDHGL